MTDSQPLPSLESLGEFLPFERLMILRGPNYWSRRPCMEAWVNLGPLNDFSSELIPGFNDRYKAWLPTVIEHRCSVGERGGFFQRLDRGTYLAHILEHTALELQTLAGSNVGFGRAREMSRTGVYKVAVRFEEETLGVASLHAARDLLKACVYDLPYDVKAEVARLHEIAERRMLGPSTRAIVEAATNQLIPFRRLNQGSLVLFGHGIHQRRIWTAETNRTSAIAESIAQDKQLTKQLLQSVGVPVPEGRRVSDADDAVAAAEEIEGAVVVKPVDANHSRGVMINLTDPHQIRIAYDVAMREGSGVLVERYVPGYEHRLLVVGDRCVAASKGEPVVVDADGIRNVRQLIDQVVNADPRRGEDEDIPLSLIEFDDLLESVLRQQGLTLESIPASGKRVLIQRTDNLLYDVTDQVHPDVAAQAVLAAKTVGLDIAGIDLVALDISCPLEDQRAAIVEVNAGPGLLMHLKPAVGKPRPVGQAIVDSMFAPGTNARVPVISVSGAANNSPTVHLIRHALQRIGWCTGWSTNDGFFLDNRQLGLSPAHAEPVAQRLLLHPDVEALVIESSAESMLRHGLGVDRVEVAVVLGVEVPAEIIREFDLDDPERHFALHRTPVDMVLPNGIAILPSDDPACIAMQPLCPGDTILLGWNGIDAAIAKQVEEGRRAVVVQDQTIRLLDGLKHKDLLPLQDISPAVPNDRLTVLGWLAGIATAWHLGMPIEAMKALLQTWTGSEESHRS